MVDWVARPAALSYLLRLGATPSRPVLDHVSVVFLNSVCHRSFHLPVLVTVLVVVFFGASLVFVKQLLPRKRLTPSTTTASEGIVQSSLIVKSGIPSLVVGYCVVLTLHGSIRSCDSPAQFRSFALSFVSAWLACTDLHHRTTHQRNTL